MYILNGQCRFHRLYFLVLSSTSKTSESTTNKVLSYCSPYFYSTSLNENENKASFKKIITTTIPLARPFLLNQAQEPLIQTFMFSFHPEPTLEKTLQSKII